GPLWGRLGRCARAPLPEAVLGLRRSGPARWIQRGAVRAAWPTLSPPAARARGTGAAAARRLKRADHVSRGQGTRAPRRPAGRLSSRRRQRICPASRPRRARDAAEAFPRPRGVIVGAAVTKRAREVSSLYRSAVPLLQATQICEGATMKIVGFEANGAL